MTYRQLSAQALAEQDYDSFLTELHNSLTDGRTDPNEVVRDTLCEIYFGCSRTTTNELPLAARTAHARPRQRHHRARALHRPRVEPLSRAQADDLVVADV